MPNVEVMYSVYFKKDFAKRFHPSKFVIRYSAVRCLIRVIQATRLIIKKPCHFGVVSYEVSGVRKGRRNSIS